MTNVLTAWILSALAIMASAYLLPGVKVDGFLTALVLALVLGIINAVIKPILIVLTLPINILTLGLFTLVINGLLIILSAKIVPGFHVQGFWWAVAFSLILFVINSALGLKK